jgi:hypothetical protein
VKDLEKVVEAHEAYVRALTRLADAVREAIS